MPRLHRTPLLRASFAPAAALAVAALLAAGCATSGSKLPVSEVTARANERGVQVVDVDVHTYYFKPNRVIVKAGQPVELAIHFKSLFVPHNFSCNHADAGIEINKSAGFMSFRRTKRVTFTPKTPGEYDFYCGVGKHMMKGMTGTLVVQ
jgi:plastocyanin